MLREFDGQGLANAVWAVGKLGLKDEALPKAVPRRAQETLREFNMQNMANAVWAFGKLGRKDEAPLKAVSTRAQETGWEFEAQNTASTVWSTVWSSMRIVWQARYGRSGSRG